MAANAIYDVIRLCYSTEDDFLAFKLALADPRLAGSGFVRVYKPTRSAAQDIGSQTIDQLRFKKNDIYISRVRLFSIPQNFLGEFESIVLKTNRPFPLGFRLSDLSRLAPSDERAWIHNIKVNTLLELEKMRARTERPKRRQEIKRTKREREAEWEKKMWWAATNGTVHGSVVTS